MPRDALLMLLVRLVVLSFPYCIEKRLTASSFIVTERGRHAQDIAQTLPLDQYDAIVVLSGDGIVYELLNGFAAHADPARAFRMPVAPVPMGSGNGSSLNLLGKAVGSLTLRQTLVQNLP